MKPAPLWRSPPGARFGGWFLWPGLQRVRLCRHRRAWPWISAQIRPDPGYRRAELASALPAHAPWGHSLRADAPSLSRGWRGAREPYLLADTAACGAGHPWGRRGSAGAGCAAFEARTRRASSRACWPTRRHERLFQLRVDPVRDQPPPLSPRCRNSRAGTASRMACSSAPRRRGSAQPRGRRPDKRCATIFGASCLRRRDQQASSVFATPPAPAWTASGWASNTVSPLPPRRETDSVRTRAAISPAAAAAFMAASSWLVPMEADGQSA